MRGRLPWALLAVLLFVGIAVWWSRFPLLTVYVDPKMANAWDQQAYETAFREAGVRRIRIVVSDSPPALGPDGRGIAVALVLSLERNPQLDAEMLALGLTGPGYAHGRVGHVYEPDVRFFVKKHQAAFESAGLKDVAAIEARMITNTAVHETWHAITLSTSHNPTDKASVMYIDPGKAPLQYGWEHLRFTKGHRDRLVSLFAFRRF